MKRTHVVSRSSFVGHVLPLVVSMFAIACSSSTSENGSGGHGSGGLTSSGGTGSEGVGSGGTQTGAGGKPGTGGAGTGGTLATGGTSAAPTGGVASTGGSVGKGGITGAPGGTTGGEGGAAGSTSPRDGGPGSGGRTAGDGGPGPDGGAPGGRTGSGSGGQVGGTTGTTPTGGSTGGNSPCKASPCVILPLGDSITHGFNSTDDAGYRSALFKLAVAANQNITFIGSLSNGPSTVSSKTFPKNHEGHDGITITGITGYVPPKKAFTTTPHIVLVHIGTNDMTSNADPTTAANQLDTLVTNLVAAAPGALIVVAKIVPLGYSNTNYNSYIAKIPDLVKAHAAKNENVIMVDMSTLPSSDIRGSGNVHPTDKGYEDMGSLWYGAIKGYLPQ
jgi:lysophospholipase L1-like esterase